MPVPKGKSSGRKSGFKRAMTSKPDSAKMVRKKQRTRETVARSSSPSFEEGPGEQSNVVSYVEEVFNTKYENLLHALSFGNKSVANAFKRRQREKEGKSDTEENEDEDSGSKSLSLSDTEDDDNEGIDEEEHSMDTIAENGEYSETEDESAAYDPDEEHNLGVSGQSVHSSISTSTFNVHLGKILSQEDVANFSKKKLKYKWVVPASDLSNCKWNGTGDCFLKDVKVNSYCNLKLKLYKHLLNVFKTSDANDFNLSKQSSVFSLCNSYRDIMHCHKKPFYLKGLEEDSSFMDGYIIHCLNHIFRTRDIVSKNDAKLSKHEDHAKEKILNINGFLDHGFTRPKVLILLPLASIAYRVIKRLIQLTPSADKEINVEHLARFIDKYGTGHDDKEVKNELQNIDGSENLKSQKSSKPSDFETLFGGNNNDDFMIGIKFTKKSIKLYNDFYSSDMIVASPLGLIFKINEAEEVKEKDVDYLSSIEVLVIDHADVIATQNWMHVNTVVEHLNRIPSKQHGTDVMRIRQWYLDGHARFYRQTILLGSYLSPDMNAFFNHHCDNYEGKVKSVCEYKGVLPKVLLQVPQNYERFDVESFADVENSRYEYFIKKVFPKIRDSSQGGIMLFTSTYFEYVRVCKFLKSQNASFCKFGDHTDVANISRARGWFFEGKCKIMIYTERAHFYHRYRIRGIQNLIFYSLPERKDFYPEIINTLEGSDSTTCTVIFSRFDQFRLERIVGTAAAKRMVSSEKSLFVFR